MTVYRIKQSNSAGLLGLSDEQGNEVIEAEYDVSELMEIIRGILTPNDLCIGIDGMSMTGQDIRMTYTRENSRLARCSPSNVQYEKAALWKKHSANSCGYKEMLIVTSNGCVWDNMMVYGPCDTAIPESRSKRIFASGAKVIEELGLRVVVPFGNISLYRYGFKPVIQPAKGSGIGIFQTRLMYNSRINMEVLSDSFDKLSAYACSNPETSYYLSIRAIHDEIYDTLGVYRTSRDFPRVLQDMLNRLPGSVTILT